MRKPPYMYIYIIYIYTCVCVIFIFVICLMILIYGRLSRRAQRCFIGVSHALRKHVGMVWRWTFVGPGQNVHKPGPLQFFFANWEDGWILVGTPVTNGWIFLAIFEWFQDASTDVWAPAAGRRGHSLTFFWRNGGPKLGRLTVSYMLLSHTDYKVSSHLSIIK